MMFFCGIISYALVGLGGAGVQYSRPRRSVRAFGSEDVQLYCLIRACARQDATKMESNINDFMKLRAAPNRACASVGTHQSVGQSVTPLKQIN